MSDLIGHIKAMRALADSFATEANVAANVTSSQVMANMSIAYNRAANLLEAQARAEASGPSFEDRPQPTGRKS